MDQVKFPSSLDTKEKKVVRLGKKRGEKIYGKDFVDMIVGDYFRFAIPFVTSNYVIFQSKVIILYNGEHLKRLNCNPKCNIWGYNNYGQVLWHVGNNINLTKSFKSVDISKDKQQVIASTLDKKKYIINTETGYLEVF